MTQDNSLLDKLLYDNFIFLITLRWDHASNNYDDWMHIFYMCHGAYLISHDADTDLILLRDLAFMHATQAERLI